MKTNRRSIAQRARRDAEGELRPPAPMLPQHGEVVGSGSITLLGKTVTVRLLATGHHSRSFGVELDGVMLGIMGKTPAMRELAKRLPSAASIRHFS